jgi:signal transduction histidine kinase
MRAEGQRRGRLREVELDVLDTSRIEAGTFSFTFSDVDLAELLRDVVAAAELAQDEVLLTTEVPGSLPHVRGDREGLRQVIQNLVDNAVKYSSAGGRVHVSATADAGGVVIDVADEGPGIPPEDQLLTLTSSGAPAAARGSPARGLGLFIAAQSRRRAAAGSRSTRPARGSVFRLELPTP